MKQLVVGYGEVGSSLFKVLSDYYGEDVSWCDIDYEPEGMFSVLHITIPYSRKFIKQVLAYKRDFLMGGGLVIIHSTVPLGTSRKCGAVHSPIRGVHPNLAQGIKTFVKYFGGEEADEASKIFSDMGLETRVTHKQENTEALKLWDTTQYMYQIKLNKKIKRWCDKRGLDFDVVYTDANKSYNEGYVTLGRPEVVRPFLSHVKGKIGGHCILQNYKLLKKS